MTQSSKALLDHAGTVGADWNAQYQPRQLDHVIGQERAIRGFKALFATRRLAHFLLAGKSGVGKTTLGRIAAQLQLCRKPAGDKACGQCRDCRIFVSGARHPLYFELSAADALGTKDELRAFLEEDLAFVPAGYRHYFVFLDEAHRLTVHAQDLLLKRMEDQNSQIVFIFALIDRHDLPEQFSSRCRVIELEAPTIEHKVIALGRVVAAERLEIEPDALQLLAMQSTGYRNAIAELQRAHEIAGAGNTITADLIKRELYSARSSAVMSLLAAALAGDMMAALAACERLAEEPHHRLRDVLRLLHYLKITQIGPHFASAAATDRLLFEDPNLAALTATLRQNAERLSVSLPAYFGAIVDYWTHVPTLTRETFMLHVAAFVDLCAPLHAAAEANPAALLVSLPLMDEPYRVPVRRRAPAVRRQHQRPESAAGDQFLSAGQARAIYEAATFLLQAYGVAFDAVLPISFKDLAINSEAEASKLLTAIGRELVQRFEAWGSGAGSSQDLHRLSYLNRDPQGNLHGLLLFHLPSSYEFDTRAWLDKWFVRFASQRVISGVPPALEYVKTADRRDAIDRHWRLVRRIWAGVDPALHAEHMPLIDRLRVSKHQRTPAGYLATARFHTSETISSGAREKAMEDRIGHVSAWHLGRWDQLFTGWETREHRERETFRNEREQFAADLLRRREATGDRLTHLQLDQLAADEQQQHDVAPDARSRSVPLWPECKSHR